MALALLSGPQDPSQLQAALNQAIVSINGLAVGSQWARFSAPIAAELISIKAAATPANGAITIAGQPDFPRKLQIRIVIGTTTTTAITAGTLTLKGTGTQGQAITETISLVQNASATLQTANAYVNVASGSVANYAANGSGTGNTLGIGVSAQLGLPLPLGFSGLAVNKENVDNADETVGTVDAVAGTVSPTTAPNATHNFDFYYTFTGPL